MTAPTIDRAIFEGLKETTGADFALELVNTFLEEAPGMLGELREAMAAKDADRFRRVAHTLKSNGNTFGALNLAAMARELELSSAAKVSEGKSGPIDALEQEYSRVSSALAELRNG